MEFVKFLSVSSSPRQQTNQWPSQLSSCLNRSLRYSLHCKPRFSELWAQGPGQPRASMLLQRRTAPCQAQAANGNSSAGRRLSQNGTGLPGERGGKAEEEEQGNKWRELAGLASSLMDSVWKNERVGGTLGHRSNTIPQISYRIHFHCLLPWL